MIYLLQVKDYNVLFIDNPVGTGYSEAVIEARYTKTNEQIAKDLVECMKGFYKKLPEFEGVPTYITTESYGGKMGAEFALLWDRVRKHKHANLKKIIIIIKEKNLIPFKCDIKISKSNKK